MLTADRGGFLRPNQGCPALAAEELQHGPIVKSDAAAERVADCLSRGECLIALQGCLVAIPELPQHVRTVGLAENSDVGPREERQRRVGGASIGRHGLRQVVVRSREAPQLKRAAAQQGIAGITSAGSPSAMARSRNCWPRPREVSSWPRTILQVINEQKQRFPRLAKAALSAS